MQTNKTALHAIVANTIKPIEMDKQFAYLHMAALDFTSCS